jgi:hypothetical protein
MTISGKAKELLFPWLQIASGVCWFWRQLLLASMPTTTSFNSYQTIILGCKLLAGVCWFWRQLFLANMPTTTSLDSYHTFILGLLTPC